ncbi:MAG TPA: hypothetical protein VGA07_05815 [Anaerolineales bacterium]
MTSISTRRTLLALACLGLAVLACLSTEISVVFHPDGSGSGEARMEMLLPADLSGEGADDFSDLIAGLSAQGWQAVKVEPAGSSQVRVTGVFPFGDQPGEGALSDALPGFSYTIEEAENGYKYYTFEGTADFSQLDLFWNEAKNDWAVNGIRFEEEDFLFEPDEEFISAEEVRSAMATYGEPKGVIRVTLPGQTPVDANPFWDNEELYLAGQTDTVVFTWQPGVRAQTPLKVVRRLEPLTSASPDEAGANLQQILSLYPGAVPKGSINFTGGISGHINNKLLSVFHGGAYTCSDYQGRVLRWLDGIRTNPDPKVRGTLAGLDYGPIQTNGGGHRAVVIFPRGTDWRATGTVLDPWPQQQPASFPIGRWADNLWFTSGANQPAPDEDAGQLYPQLTGGTSSYPASVELQGDLSRGLARPTRVLMVRSPVTTMITFADGRRLGALPDGTIVNELPGEADMYGFPSPDVPGEIHWMFFLPEAEYQVELTGSGEGEFHALVATPEEVYGYGGQPIAPGDAAGFAVDPSGQPSDLTLPGGTMAPARQLAPDEIDAAMGIVGEAQAADQLSGPQSGAAAEGLPVTLPNLPTLLGITCLCLGGGALGFGLLYLGLRRGRRAAPG